MNKRRCVIGFLSLAFALGCPCGCKPSAHMGRASHQPGQAPHENDLSPQLAQKIRDRYREETGRSIRIVRTHEISALSDDKMLVKLIAELEGKKYLITVMIETVDEVPVVDILYCLDKEIK